MKIHQPLRYISVMGTMGSGKTTAARLISQELHYHLVEENFGENAFLPRFYKRMNRWAFHSQTFFLMEKMTQLSSIDVILNKARQGRATSKDPVGGKSVRLQGIVQDTPIEQDVFSYAKAQHSLGNMDDAEWKLYRKIYDSFAPHLPKPDMIVYLKTSLSEVEKRIASRGRGYEKGVPRKYLQMLEQLNEEWISDRKPCRVLTIETDGLNIVTSKIAQQDLLDQLRRALKSD